ncbi:MAG: EscU/YscU/HrcU family type III secretion system export apparatus switch protein [Bryobacteraceae bacterium]|nr:EscU/YscU/HrcU family type III secretion system export apparatus switch protein [Bryobacteraceae bacterium]
MSQSERTEKATPRRLEQARREGNFPVSDELVSAAQFAAFAALAISFAPESTRYLAAWVRAGLRNAFLSAEIGPETAAELIRVLAAQVGQPLAMGGALLAVTAIAVQMGVSGGGLALARLSPDLKRLNPGPRLRSLFANNVAAFLKAAVLLPLFLYTVWVLALDEIGNLARLRRAGLGESCALLGEILKTLLQRFAAVFLVLGVLDLVRRRHKYFRQLRMSKQEIREELKQQEGNPQAKARIRRLQRDARRRRMMSDVPSATVVVVNPTHYAVALRYEVEAGTAPRVVAKGKNWLAARIRRKALEHQVPIVENPPLAQAMYFGVKVGQEIPPHLYRAVAEILAYIYRLLHGRGPRA